MQFFPVCGSLHVLRVEMDGYPIVLLCVLKGIIDRCCCWFRPSFVDLLMKKPNCVDHKQDLGSFNEVYTSERERKTEIERRRERGRLGSFTMEIISVFSVSYTCH